MTKSLALQLERRPRPRARDRLCPPPAPAARRACLPRHRHRASAPRSGGGLQRALFHAAAASRRRSTCSTPQNASSTSSWKDGRARRRCSNWPDIASSRSAAAATILARDRATPGVCARPPVSEDTPREHEPRLALGSQLRERGHVLLVEERRQGRRAPPPRTPRSRRRPRTTRRPARRAAGRSPARRSSSPLPVSPVIAFSPGPNERSASRISTRFSMRSLRSMVRHATRPIEKPRITGLFRGLMRLLIEAVSRDLVTIRPALLLPAPARPRPSSPRCARIWSGGRRKWTSTLSQATST